MVLYNIIDWCQSIGRGYHQGEMVMIPLGKDIMALGTTCNHRGCFETGKHYVM